MYRYTCDRGVDADFIHCFGYCEQCWHSLRAVSPTSHLPSVGWIWESPGRGPTQLTQTGQGDIPWEALVTYNVCLPEKPYTCFLCPGSGQILSHGREHREHFFFLFACACTTVCFCFSKLPCQPMSCLPFYFLSSFVFPSAPLRRGKW